jgi:hypothetical protein
MEHKINYNGGYVYATMPHIYDIAHLFSNSEEAYQELKGEVLDEAQSKGYNHSEKEAILSHLEIFIKNSDVEWGQNK